MQAAFSNNAQVDFRQDEQDEQDEQDDQDGWDDSRMAGPRAVIPFILFILSILSKAVSLLSKVSVEVGHQLAEEISGVVLPLGPAVGSAWGKRKVEVLPQFHQLLGQHH